MLLPVLSMMPSARVSELVIVCAELIVTEVPPLLLFKTRLKNWVFVVPEMVLAPALVINATVPEPALKVPLLAKLPMILRVNGAVTVAPPLIVMLLKFVALIDVPSKEEVPVNKTVEEPALKVPLLVKSPPTLMVVVGALSVEAGLITT